MAAFTMAHFETDDYDAWKETFDSDRGGRKQAAEGHVISRGVDDPRQVFVRVEFASSDGAAAFRERLMQSGALEGVGVITPPTVVEVVESAEY